jgi:hypothetical protein
MRLCGRASATPALRPPLVVFSWLAVGALLLGAPGAKAQNPQCEQLRAALSQPVSVDPASAAGARKARAELDRTESYARSIGCDNQQFLFFGSPPPPQCGGLKARIAGLKSQYDALAARASGDSPQRQALRAHYNALCNAPRERNFFEQLFGGVQEAHPEDGVVAPMPGEGDGNGARGGSQAVCVRTCDGGFFPLNFSARSASTDDLTNLCQALCPNAEVKLYTKNPASEINNALGADGTAYSDLPNALKFTKSFDPACGCKPPNQSWVEALAHAEQVLGEMGGAKASDTTITEQQSRAMAQPLPAKPGKAASAPILLPTKAAPPPTAAAEQRLIEGAAPDGSPRQVRVVGPNL